MRSTIIFGMVETESETLKKREEKVRKWEKNETPKPFII